MAKSLVGAALRTKRVQKVAMGKLGQSLGSVGKNAATGKKQSFGDLRKAAKASKQMQQVTGNASTGKVARDARRGMIKGTVATGKTVGHVKRNKSKYLAGGAVAGAAMVGGAVKKRQEDKKFKNRAKKFLGM